MPKVTPTPIRYRPDGSIDTAWHMQVGRHMRSLKAHELMGRARPRKTPSKPAYVHWFTRLLRPLSLH